MCVSFVSSTCGTVCYSNANAEFPFLTGLARTPVYLARLLPVQGMVLLFAHTHTHIHAQARTHAHRETLICRITPSSACAHKKNGISCTEARTHTCTDITHTHTLWEPLKQRGWSVPVSSGRLAGDLYGVSAFRSLNMRGNNLLVRWILKDTLPLCVCLSLSFSLSLPLSLSLSLSLLLSVMDE